MMKVLAVIFFAALLPVSTPSARAQNLDDIFRQINPSVIVVRSKGRDVSAQGVIAPAGTPFKMNVLRAGKVIALQGAAQ